MVWPLSGKLKVKRLENQIKKSLEEKKPKVINKIKTNCPRVSGVFLIAYNRATEVHFVHQAMEIANLKWAFGPGELI